ncbi:MAG TPA: methyltransferase domain-containing protein [Vicinamibacterales bacterium]|nr:methyltransferase domain-containing protein [Vicinamibacterales bacterium]
MRRVITMVDTNVALRLVQSQRWHHNFEIVPGVRTHGSYDPSALWKELRLPEDLHGTSLADVGASNGYFSFEARKRGARVVAFDFRHKDNSGFGLAQYLNGMRDIEHHHVNVLQMASSTSGQFDVVLALGLLYHVSDPYLALANCAGLARTRLLIESYCIDASVPIDVSGEPLMKFISDPRRFPAHGHINNDPSNFWGFTSVCLQRMVEDVGFVVRRTRVHDDRVLVDAERAASNENKTRLRLAHGTVPRVPAGENPEDPDAWKMF